MVKKRKMGRHKVRESNPFDGDLRQLESYGKAMDKKKYTPVLQPRLAKVGKPEVIM
jgi:hypothetical protein